MKSKLKLKPVIIIAALLIVVAIISVSLSNANNITGTWISADGREAITFTRDGIYQWEDMLTGEYESCYYEIDRRARWIGLYDSYGYGDEFYYTVRSRYLTIEMYGYYYDYVRY